MTFCGDLTIQTHRDFFCVVAGVLPKYFSSEWSVAQFRLTEGSQYFVAFGHQKNTIVIIGMDGRYEFLACHVLRVSG